MCKRCVIGVATDFETNAPVLIYKGESTDVDLSFDFCPQCGSKNSDKEPEVSDE